MSATLNPVDMDSRLLDLVLHVGLDRSPQPGAQMWQCVECEQERQWGCSRPADRWFRPALICDCCEEVTRHEFLRVLR